MSPTSSCQWLKIILYQVATLGGTPEAREAPPRNRKNGLRGPGPIGKRWPHQHSFHQLHARVLLSFLRLPLSKLFCLPPPIAMNLRHLVQRVRLNDPQVQVAKSAQDEPAYFHMGRKQIHQPQTFTVHRQATCIYACMCTFKYNICTSA